MHRRTSPSIEAVVADVGRLPGVLTRHDLPRGVSVSFLFDGEDSRRGTGQWRVVAPNEPTLRDMVAALAAALVRAGVAYEPPRVTDTTCHFRDLCPWPQSSR